VEAKDFQALVEQLGELTAGQRDALVEAIKRKSSVKDAVALIETRFAAAPRCGHCRSEKVATWAKSNPLTRYKCSACGKTFNALTGTPLARLQRRDAWLRYAQALADGVSLRKAAKRCRIALDTAFRWRHRFLKSAKDRKATSVGGIVEADETYLGARGEPGARGRTLCAKSLVAGAVESRGDRAGSLRLAHVPAASQAELGPFVRGAIDQAEATVKTDAWGGYGDLAAHGARHRPVVQGVPARAAQILPWAHTVFSNLKAWIWGTFHGVSTKHLHRYLMEFVYRFNRRALEDDLFFYVLRRAAHGEPIPYHRLVAEATE